MRVEEFKAQLRPVKLVKQTRNGMFLSTGIGAKEGPGTLNAPIQHAQSSEGAPDAGDNSYCPPLLPRAVGQVLLMHNSFVHTILGQNADWFIAKMNLKDPRLYPAHFAQKQKHVWDAISAWGPLPTQEDDFWFTRLELHSDGSTVLSTGWPATSINAGWGVVFFAAQTNVQRRFWGALW